MKRRRVVNRRSAQIESVDCALEIMRDFEDDDGEKEEEEEGEFSLVVVVVDDLSCGNNTKRRLMLLLLVVVLLSSLVDFGFVIVERESWVMFLGGDG